MKRFYWLLVKYDLDKASIVIITTSFPYIQKTRVNFNNAQIIGTNL